MDNGYGSINIMLNIKIKGTNVVVEEELKDYLFKKLNFLEKFIKNEDALCEVELAKITNHHKQGEIYKAEIHLSFAHNDHYADAEADDLYTAIDLVRENIERSVVSKKKKYMDVWRRGAGKIKDIIKRIRN